MKRKFISLLLILLLCGCSDKSNRYENYQHYDIKKFKEINSHTFYSEKGEETYIVADISPEIAEGRDNAIFYKIGDNDYILLDEFSVNSYYSDLTNPEKYTYFDYDKYSGEKRLFIVRNSGATLWEYKFNEEKYEKIDLMHRLDNTSISSNPQNYVLYSSIEKVDSDNIYYRGSIHNTDQVGLLVKCSLSTYKCEVNRKFL